MNSKDAAKTRNCMGSTRVMIVRSLLGIPARASIHGPTGC